MKRLTGQQREFINQYLVDKNATQAAIRAGYAEGSASSTGCILLQKPHIKAALEKALKEQEKRTKIDADDILMNIARLGLKAEEKGDMRNALKAQELLGKNKRLFTDRVEHEGSVVIEVVTGVPRPDAENED